MKKSSALMLSYIIILFLTTLVDAFFDWEGIDQVALAATIAGYCFAIADYYGWEASYNQPMVNAKKEYLNTYRSYLNEVLDLAHKDEVGLKQVIELLEPYRNSHESIAEVLGDAKDLADIVDQAKTSANTSLEKLPDRMEAVVKKEKKIQKSSFKEAGWATMGFLMFFLLIIFDSLADKIMPVSSITTVAAFALIMLNYFIKDLLEADMQKDVAETAALCHEMKEKAANYKTKKDTLVLVEKAQKMISEIGEFANKEEDADHGQT